MNKVEQNDRTVALCSHQQRHQAGGSWKCFRVFAVLPAYFTFLRHSLYFSVTGELQHFTTSNLHFLVF